MSANMSRGHSFLRHSERGNVEYYKASGPFRFVHIQRKHSLSLQLQELSAEVARIGLDVLFCKELARQLVGKGFLSRGQTHFQPAPFLVPVYRWPLQRWQR